MDVDNPDDPFLEPGNGVNPQNVDVNQPVIGENPQVGENLQNIGDNPQVGGDPEDIVAEVQGAFEQGLEEQEEDMALQAENMPKI